jgi:hypothetical protein
MDILPVKKQKVLKQDAIERVAVTIIKQNKNILLHFQVSRPSALLSS